MSLEPAAAALAGMVVLDEFLSPVQWLAVAAVIVASVGATRGSDAISGEPVPELAARTHGWASRRVARNHRARWATMAP